ncbi:MAG: hypothetical protein MR885_07125 [Ruminococcus bromii]|nr:hypothetical protein [Ruminococcus bromii]
MINFIDIKIKIGEWIEQHKDTQNANEIIDYHCDGQNVYISMEKSSINPYIGATVTTDDYVYRFVYKGISENSFDMSKLEHLTTTKKEFDD